MSGGFSLPPAATLLLLTWQHIQVSGIALLLATAIAIPISLGIYKYPSLSTAVIGLMGIFYTIPSIALIILLIPIFGLNERSVIAALVIYAQVLLIRNMVTGLRSVDSTIILAAEGMGMTSWQKWKQVQLPVAAPIFLAGMRITAVTAIAIATIGAKFGAGGLGTLLFEGIAQSGRYDKILIGAVLVGILAFSTNSLLGWLERRMSYPQ